MDKSEKNFEILRINIRNRAVKSTDINECKKYKKILFSTSIIPIIDKTNRNIHMTVFNSYRSFSTVFKRRYKFEKCLSTYLLSLFELLSSVDALDDDN